MKLPTKPPASFLASRLRRSTLSHARGTEGLKEKREAARSLADACLDYRTFVWKHTSNSYNIFLDMFKVLNKCLRTYQKLTWKCVNTAEIITTCILKKHTWCWWPDLAFWCWWNLLQHPSTKDNERNLCHKKTDSDLKVHALHYANELLVRVRLSSQTLKL